MNNEKQEYTILDFATLKGQHWSAIEPQFALTLARATRNTLVAEEEVVKLRVAECHHQLETLQDELDEIQARLKEARLQVGGVMEFLEEENIHIDYGSFSFEQPLMDASSLVASPIHDLGTTSYYKSDSD